MNALFWLQHLKGTLDFMQSFVCLITIEITLYVCIFTVQTYHELKYPSSFSCLVAMNNPLSHSSTFDFQIDGVMIILF